MLARHTFRWFFWASCVLAVFFCARPARADAPMCDTRGMSVNAPPPVTPIGDARVESMAAPICRTATVVRFGHRVQRAATVVDSSTPIDGCLKIEHVGLPTPLASKVTTATATGLLKSPGHASGVFRPPRST
jgi:hypothetical protein